MWLIRDKENPFAISHCLVFILGTSLSTRTTLASD